jgi:hypothetical protein
MIPEIFKNQGRKKELSQSIFTPQMTMIQESRIIKHWHKMGILPNKNTGLNKWTKYTLPEMIWINTVTEMREFGLPLPHIKMTYDKLISPKLENWNTLIQSIIYDGLSDVYLIVTKKKSFLIIDDTVLTVNNLGEVIALNKYPKKSTGLTIQIDDIVQSTLSENTTNGNEFASKLYTQFNKKRSNNLKQS